jgi:WD40 repeat protein
LSPASVVVEFKALTGGEPKPNDLVIDAAGSFTQGEATMEAGNFSLGGWPIVRACAVDREGNTALIGLTSGTTLLVSLHNGGYTHLPTLDSPVVTCAFLNDGTAMIAGLSGTVQLYEPRQQKVSWAFDLGFKLSSGAVSRASPRAIFGGDDGEVFVVDLQARDVVMAIDYRIDEMARYRYRGTDDWRQAPTSVAISADGRRGLAAFVLPGLVVLDAEDRAIRVLGPPRGPFGAVSLSEDGHHALTGGRNGQLALWDVDGGGPIASVIVDEGITALTIAGNRFAAGDWSGRVCLGEIDGHLTARYEPREDLWSTFREDRDWRIRSRSQRLVDHSSSSRKASPAKRSRASSPTRRKST